MKGGTLGAQAGTPRIQPEAPTVQLSGGTHGWQPWKALDNLSNQGQNKSLKFLASRGPCVDEMGWLGVNKFSHKYSPNTFKSLDLLNHQNSSIKCFSTPSILAPKMPFMFHQVSSKIMLARLVKFKTLPHSI